MSILSVDLGTSNTVAVLSTHGRPPRVVEVEGSTAMPSAVFAGEDGSLVVGREAERRARLDPARFEPNPKRRIDEGTLLLGNKVVSVTEVFAAVLGKVAGEVSRQLGGTRPDQVRLTHPAQWGPVRRNVLLSAARQAGLGANVMLVAEPVAAAAHFASYPGRALTTDQALAVYDLGAGTFDVAVVAAGFTVLAEAGLPDLGGLDVDQALLAHVGRQVSGRDPRRWQRLMRPADSNDRRARRALQEDVRAAKEALSAHPQTDLPLPEPFDDVLVTRAELESLIRPNLLRSVELLAVTVRQAGVRQDRLAGIYLVGGSSRIPLVATLIAEQLRIVATNLDQPETAVALGAHHVTSDDMSLRTGNIPPAARPLHVPAAAPPAMPPAGRQQIFPATPQSMPFKAPAPPDPPKGRRAVWLSAVAVALVCVVVGVIVVVTSGEDARDSASTPQDRPTSPTTEGEPTAASGVTIDQPKRVDGAATCEDAGSAADMSEAVGMSATFNSANTERCVYQFTSPSGEYAGTVGLGFLATTATRTYSGATEIDVLDNSILERDDGGPGCTVAVALAPADDGETYMFEAESTFRDTDSCTISRKIVEFVYSQLPNE